MKYFWSLWQKLFFWWKLKNKLGWAGPHSSSPLCSALGQTKFWYLPDIFQTPSLTPSEHTPNTFKTPARYLTDIFQTPYRHLPDSFPTPSRHLPDINQTPFRNRPLSFLKKYFKISVIDARVIASIVDFYLQGIQELCQSEKISCQTSILTHLIPLSFLMIFLCEIEKEISVTVSFPWKLLKKSPAIMRGWC